MFLTELMQIVSIVFSPVITLESVQCLKQMISEHLLKFTELFPDNNILPKHHYMIHIPTMIKNLGPLIRSSCFSFEAAHNFFKQLGRKQNFKNLIISLAKRHQLFDCASFGDIREIPSTPIIFN